MYPVELEVSTRSIVFGIHPTFYQTRLDSRSFYRRCPRMNQDSSAVIRKKCLTSRVFAILGALQASSDGFSLTNQGFLLVKAPRNQAVSTHLIVLWLSHIEYGCKRGSSVQIITWIFVFFVMLHFRRQRMFK